MYHWIDTHCHLDASQFDADRDAVRQRAATQGVVHCVIPTVLPSFFDQAAHLAHHYGDSYALGLHPLALHNAPEDALRQLELALVRYADDPRLVAVGEIGLDYFVPELNTPELRHKQWHFYLEQLRLAKAFGLPVLLHVRRSTDDILKGIAQVYKPVHTPTGRPAAPQSLGIAHAFSGSVQQAQRCAQAGLMLGFGGAMTFEAAQAIRRLATQLPMSSWVLETDAPDMPPHWLYRTALQREGGLPQARNEPRQLVAIGRVMAQLRCTDLAQVAHANWNNAVRALPKLAQLLPTWESQ